MFVFQMLNAILMAGAIGPEISGRVERANPKRSLGHYNQRCDPIKNCYDCRSEADGAICLWDEGRGQCRAQEEESQPSYWFQYLRDCADTESLCMQNYDEELE